MDLHEHRERRDAVDVATPVQSLVTIVLAAGEGSRYQASSPAPQPAESAAPAPEPAESAAALSQPPRPKQLASIAGVPMLRRVLDVLDGFGEHQVVVLGAHAERVRPVIATHRWSVVVAEDWATGPGASLRAGLRAVPSAEAAMIVLGDLPWLRREAIDLVLQAAAQCSEDAVRAFDGDTPGHPLLIRGAMLARAREAPDAGLGAALAGTPLARVPCAELGVARDVDTVADLSLAPRA